MKRVFKVLTILTMSSIFCFAAEPVKTQEQKNGEVLAHVAGATFRHQKEDKEQCSKSYQGEQLQACLKGYAEADANLNKPAK